MGASQANAVFEGPVERVVARGIPHLCKRCGLGAAFLGARIFLRDGGREDDPGVRREPQNRTRMQRILR